MSATSIKLITKATRTADMVGLPSRYTLTAHTALQVKLIAFHKVDNIVHQLPTELKSILVSLIKRNLTVK